MRHGATFAVLLLACNPNPPAGDPDLATSPPDDLAQTTNEDLAVATSDMARDMTGLPPADLKMQSFPDFAGADLLVKNEPGQCYTNAHCGAMRTCNKEAPGGICDGCMGFGANCKSGFDDECIGGTCARGCSGNGDCLPGWTCASFMGSQYCRLKSCTVPADCGPHLDCRNTGIGLLCYRFLCPGNNCPSGTTCLNGVCVENYLTF
jgi:hypothetical protein